MVCQNCGQVMDEAYRNDLAVWICEGCNSTVNRHVISSAIARIPENPYEPSYTEIVGNMWGKLSPEMLELAKYADELASLFFPFEVK